MPRLRYIEESEKTAGLERHRSASRNGQAACDLAHFHHAILDLHFVNLQLLGDI